MSHRPGPNELRTRARSLIALADLVYEDQDRMTAKEIQICGVMRDMARLLAHAISHIKDSP